VSDRRSGSGAVFSASIGMRNRCRCLSHSCNRVMKSPRIRIDNRTSYLPKYVTMFSLLYVYLRDNQESILSCDRNNNVVFSLIFFTSPHNK